MNGVGALAATWAWSVPPARPREVNELLGDTPRPPSEGENPPLDSPFTLHADTAGTEPRRYVCDEAADSSALSVAGTGMSNTMRQQGEGRCY